MSTPAITVLMPVHNAEEHIREAIESILMQTFTDFEFLIVDDGSTDSTPDIVRTYNDPRIKLVKNTRNRGTVHVLNQGIELARGKYIARMDADDISLPNRLEKQFAFMERNPSIGISGTAMRLIKKGKLKNTRKQPCTNEELKIQLLFGTCFFHPTVILRTDLAKTHPYPDNLVYTQDYNCWTNLADKTQFANLAETLLYFRTHTGQISSKKADLQTENARKIRSSYLQRFFGSQTEKAFAIHNQISETVPNGDLTEIEKWLEHLIDLNQEFRKFDRELFNHEIGRKWWLICRKQPWRGKKALLHYTSAPLYTYYRPDTGKYLRFLIKCHLPKALRK